MARIAVTRPNMAIENCRTSDQDFGAALNSASASNAPDRAKQLKKQVVSIQVPKIPDTIMEVAVSTWVHFGQILEYSRSNI
jgi:hypothetical protein